MYCSRSLGQGNHGHNAPLALPECIVAVPQPLSRNTPLILMQSNICIQTTKRCISVYYTKPIRLLLWPERNHSHRSRWNFWVIATVLANVKQSVKISANPLNTNYRKFLLALSSPLNDLNGNEDMSTSCVICKPHILTSK